MFSSWLHVPAGVPALPAADNDFVFGGAVPSGWALTRLGTALSRGPDGRWVSYSANIPRSYHHPVTKINMGTLLEPVRTNLYFSSRPLVATAKNATVTADTTTQSPFGLGATRIVDNAISGSHGFDMPFSTSGRATSIPDGSTVSVQLTFKPVGTITRSVIFALTKSGVYRTCDFSWAGGVPTVLAHTMTSARLLADTDGFYRLEFTLNYGTGTTSVGSTNLVFQQDDGNRSYIGDGTKGLLVAHFGAEIGPECTSPIISSSASSNTTVSRSEDILVSDADWLKVGGKTIGIQYTPLGVDPQVILSAVGGDNIEFSNSSEAVQYFLTTAGTSIGLLSGSAPPAGVERTAVLTADFNRFWLIQNGRRLAVDEDGLAPQSIDSIRIGARVAGGLAGPMLLRRIKHWDTGLDKRVATVFSADLSTPGIAPDLPVLDIQPTRTVDPSTSIFLFPITMSGEPSGATVSYRTVDGTAKAGIDYTAIFGTVTIEPGDSIYSITVPLLTRSLTETRSFTLELHSPSGAVLGNAVCTFVLTKSTPTAHAPLKLTNFNGPLTSDWAVTRNTPGYVRGSDGLWVSVPADQPRIHYTSATDVGILIEPASSQCLFDSINFGYLLNSTQTLVTNVQTPTGMRLKRWRETAVSGNHLFRATWNTAAATWPTGDFILWAIIKPVGPRTRYRFSVKGIDGVFKNAVFELTGNGSIVSTSAADVVARIEPEAMATGWYRVGVARPQAVSANVSAEFDIGPLDPATNSTTVAGDVTYGLDMCHFQCEAGLFWTSPIPANAAIAATPRAADVLKANGSWYSRNSFALGVKFKRLGPVPSSQRIVQFRDVAPAVDDFGILTVDGTIRAPLTTGAVFRGNIDGPVNATGSYSTAVVSIDTTRYSMFVGGVLSGEIAMPGKDMPRIVQHVRFGSKEQDGSQGAPIVIQTVAYWTVGLSNDEGTVFSTDLTGTPPGQVEPDPLPLVNIPASMSVNEGEAIVIPVTKVGNGACSVNFRTVAQTATRITDYTGIGSTDPLSATAYHVDFAANESTKLVTVQTVADTDDTEQTETFGINISVYNNPPDCQLGNGVGVVNIVQAVKPPDSAGIYSRDKGFATEANCGEGRAWYVVTNLNDSGAGSLRDALSASNRNIIFEVGGTIMLSSHITGTISNVTVNGETAPYPGIIIQKYELQVRGSNLRYTHLTLEKGHDPTPAGLDNGDCVKVNPGNGTVGLYTRSNIHFDHCLFLWSQDEMVEIWPWNANLSNITFSNCYFAEALWKPQTLGYAAHVKVAANPSAQPQHNYGLIIGFGTKTTDVQNCVFADMDMRFPFIDHSTSVVVANTISFNCTKGATIQQNRDPLPKEPMLVTCRGYLCISGPNSTAHSGFRFHSTAGTGDGTTFGAYYYAGTRVCVSNLYSMKGGTATSTYITPGVAVEKPNGTPICLEGGKNVAVETTTPPIDIPGAPVVARTSADIYKRALDNCGPHPKRRFGHAARVIKKLRDKAGQWVNHESEVGGRSVATLTTRLLNGNTSFPDGTPIPVRPAAATGTTTPTAQQISDAKAWVNLFRKQVQYDFD